MCSFEFRRKSWSSFELTQAYGLRRKINRDEISSDQQLLFFVKVLKVSSAIRSSSLGIPPSSRLNHGQDLFRWALRGTTSRPAARLRSRRAECPATRTAPSSGREGNGDSLAEKRRPISCVCVRREDPQDKIYRREEQRPPLPLINCDDTDH